MTLNLKDKMQHEAGSFPVSTINLPMEIRNVKIKSQNGKMKAVKAILDGRSKQTNSFV
ncbi:hypothetical protein M758_2G142900 [Ceratodon purpureus]|nr:hypothetical protein M758_2G142900 [Ceratodon purpureus]